MAWSLLFYIQSLVSMGIMLSVAQGLECAQSTGKKSHLVCGSLPSQLLSWLCNLLCGLCVSSFSQVAIRHAKCAKQKARANPTVNAGAQRDCVDGDISVLCNYSSKLPSDQCIWFVIYAFLWMSDVKTIRKHSLLTHLYSFFTHQVLIWNSSGELSERSDWSLKAAD